MNADLAQVKRRGAVMMALSGLFLLAAVAGFAGYFQFGLGWARWAAVAALAIGFGAQIWFIASLRRHNSLGKETARHTRVAKGA